MCELCECSPELAFLFYFLKNLRARAEENWGEGASLTMLKRLVASELKEVDYAEPTDEEIEQFWKLFDEEGADVRI